MVIREGLRLTIAEKIAIHINFEEISQPTNLSRFKLLNKVLKSCQYANEPSLMEKFREQEVLNCLFQRVSSQTVLPDPRFLKFLIICCNLKDNFDRGQLSENVLIWSQECFKIDDP